MLTEREFDNIFIERHGLRVHERLKGATVGIAGLGGLGSGVAVLLARAGVGAFVLADFDIVDPSNIHRQQYFIEQIGIKKTEAITQNLKSINPYLKIEAHCLRVTHENISIFDPVDVLVEAFDKAEEKAMLIEAVRLRHPNKPIIAASGIAGYGKASTIKTKRHSDNLYIVGDGKTEVGPDTPLMATRVGIAFSHQANAVIRLLLGLTP